MKRNVLLVLTGLLLATVVFGVEKLKGDDFIFLKSARLGIFPELSYEANPAILLNISNPFLLNSYNFEATYLEIEKKRINNLIGLKDGTETVSTINLVPQVDFSTFLPFGKKKVFGLDFNYLSEHVNNTLIQKNYNAVSENISSQIQTNSFTTGLNLYLASAAGKKANIGYSLGYNFDYDPKVFKWITDSSYNPTLLYTTENADTDYIDVITHGIDGSVGLNFPLDKHSVSLGVVYKGFYKDSSNEYIAVDSDGDGYKDKLYTLKDYYFLDTKYGGPVVAVSSFNHENYSILTNVDITASAILFLSKGVSLIADGNYSVVDYRYNHYYKHILTELVKKDVSYYDQIYNSGLGSFNVLLGFDFKDPKKTKNLRIGVRYFRDMEKYTQNGDTAAGTDLYSTINPNHYIELNLGTNPANDSIVNSNIYPSSIEVQQIKLESRYKWVPDKKLKVYFDFNVLAVYNTKNYRAFNLDTRTVWEEQAVSKGLNIKMDSLLGIAFPLGKKLVCTLDLQNFHTLGDAYISTETNTFDVDKDRPSENGENYLLSDKDMNFNLNLGFMVTW